MAKICLCVNSLESVFIPRGHCRGTQNVSKSPNIWNWLALLGLICQVLAFPNTSLFGQTLRLSSVAAPNDRVAMELSLDCPAGKEPTALQWQISIPKAKLSLIDDTILIGSAAQEAGKKIECAPKGKSTETYTSVCILSGDQKPIQNGVIAILRFRTVPKAPAGPARIKVQQVVAVSTDLKQLTLKDVETEIEVRPK